MFILRCLYAYVHPACSHIRHKKKASQKGGSVHFVLILMIVLILFSLRRRVGVDQALAVLMFSILVSTYFSTSVA